MGVKLLHQFVVAIVVIVVTTAFVIAKAVAGRILIPAPRWCRHVGTRKTNVLPLIPWNALFNSLLPEKTVGLSACTRGMYLYRVENWEEMGMEGALRSCHSTSVLDPADC